MAEDSFDKLKAWYEAIQNASPNTDGTYTVEGKRVSASQYKAYKKSSKITYNDAVKVRKDTEAKKKAAQFKAAAEAKAVKDKAKGESEAAAKVIKDSKSRLDRLQKENQIDAYLLAGKRIPAELQQRYVSMRLKPGEDSSVIESRITERNKEISQIPTTTTVAPVTTTDPVTTVTGKTRRNTSVEPQGPYRPGTFGVPAVSTPTGPTGPTVPGTGGDKKVVTKKPPATKVVVDWKPKFREMFPKQSWLLDLDPTKYSGLFKLLETGVKDKMWLTPESQERFAAQLQGTDFYVELKTNDTVKNITSLVGDLGFDKTPFNNFLKDAMNFGWKDDTLKQKVYEEAFRKDPATGNYVNTTTIERVRKSSPYLTVANIGKAFFNTVSDSTIAGVLTGSMVQDDVVRQQRELAKGKYGHLSSLIDQGLSLEDISDSYKTQASKVLEKDINSIDMSQGAYSTAFDFGEEGKKRLMSTSEWEVKLRSDANFGWDKTQNARDEARALASSISQAFGRVL